MPKMKKYQITLTEERLMLMAQFVDNCHRFAAGQTVLYNVLQSIDMQVYSLRKRLQMLHSLVTPCLGFDTSYGWSGSGCLNEAQRKFIAQSYYLYREIYHQRNLIEGIDNVYTSETLCCADSGEPIKIKVINKETEETI